MLFKNFKRKILVRLGAIIPVLIIGFVWYDNLSINETPIIQFLAILLMFWILVMTYLGCLAAYNLVYLYAHRREAQKILRSTDPEQILHTKTLNQLDQILQVLSIQRTRIIRRKIKQESTEETRERLIGLIMKVLRSDEMQNNAPHH